MSSFALVYSVVFGAVSTITDISTLVIPDTTTKEAFIKATQQWNASYQYQNNGATITEYYKDNSLLGITSQTNDSITYTIIQNQ